MKLKEICEINPKTREIDDDTEVSFVPMPSVTEDGKIDTSDIRSYQDVKKGYTVFQEGDVLFAKITPCMENGKGAIAYGLMNGKGCGSSEFHVLRPNKDVATAEWIYYLTAWEWFRNEAEKHMTGSAGQKRVPKAYLENYVVNVPSLEEQKKQTKVLVQLQQIIDDRKKELICLDNLIKARFVELFGDYHINDKGFETHKGSELFKFSSGKFLSEENRLDEGIPVYGGNGIAWYTDSSLIDYPTVIIGRVGAWCGNVHMVTDPVWITDNAIYIKEQKTNKYTLEFLTELMKMMDFHQYADFSGQPKITQKPLETLEYLTPPVEMQNEFTDFVHQVAKSKVAVKKALDETELLFRSLMQKYFGRGEN